MMLKYGISNATSHPCPSFASLVLFSVAYRLFLRSQINSRNKALSRRNCPKLKEYLLKSRFSSAQYFFIWQGTFSRPLIADLPRDPGLLYDFRFTGSEVLATFFKARCFSIL